MIITLPHHTRTPRRMDMSDDFVGPSAWTGNEIRNDPLNQEDIMWQALADQDCSGYS